MVRRALLALVALLSAVPAYAANELYVDRKTIAAGDVVAITVALEGEYASLADVDLPLQNLILEGPPSTSTSYTIMNGVASHRRVLRYIARAKGEGRAVVGPVVLQLPGGERDVLQAVPIDVIRDSAAGSNDPLTVFRGLIAAGRPPTFVVAEVDRGEVLAGQEIIVTWTLYNAAVVEQWGITEGPKLDDFWTEEIPLDRDRGPRHLVMDGYNVSQLPIRRVALFPLRSGQLTVGSLAIAASVMTRGDSTDIFGRFEGRLDEVRWRSAPLTIDVRPLPTGGADAVGDLSLRCDLPSQLNGGPVVVPVMLSGRGNLRAATVPRIAGPVDGMTQVAEGKVSVSRTATDATMSRSWRYLIFPAHDGPFTIPPIVASVITSAGKREELRCEARTLVVQAAADANLPPRGERIAPRASRIDVRRMLPWLAGAVFAAIALVFAMSRLARTRRRRREIDALVAGPPSQVRERVDERLRRRGLDPALVMAERSDRGDSYRALRSLVEGLERERIAFDAAELRARVADLVATIAE